MGENSWKEYSVDEFAVVIGGGTPSTKNPENFGGDIPWLTPKDLSNYGFRYIERGERNITDLGLANSNASMLPAGTVLLSSRAPVGYLAIAKNPIATNQGFKNLVIKEGFDSEFIYYLLKNNVEFLLSQASGTTFVELSGATVKKLRFTLPPLPEQRRIARILGTLDDKIELNRRMNATLEAIARALFKSWFVDFDPVRAKLDGRPSGLPAEIEALFPDSLEDSELGKVPRGWEVTSLGKLFPKNKECVLTGPFGSKLHAHDYRNEGVPLILVKHINHGRIIEDEVPLVGYDKVVELERYRLQIGDIVFSRVGAVGRTAYIYPKHVGWLFSGQTLRVRIPDAKTLNPKFLAQTYAEPDFISMVENHALGTTRPSLNTKLLEGFKFVCPPTNIQETWSNLTEPGDSSVQNRWEENKTLSNLRKLLLAQLIQGR